MVYVKNVREEFMKSKMKFRLKNIIHTPEDKLIHVRLDARTCITISKLSSLEVWLVKYPEAKVIPSQ